MNNPALPELPSTELPEKDKVHMGQGMIIELAKERAANYTIQQNANNASKL